MDNRKKNGWQLKLIDHLLYLFIIYRVVFVSLYYKILLLLFKRNQWYILSLEFHPKQTQEAQ